MTYSQAREDDIVVGYFGEFVGTFLDLGAADGRNNSNTYLLMERGWSGLCVEASEHFFGPLCQTHSDNPRVSMVNVAITHRPSGPVTFYASKDQVSTILPEHAEKWRRIADTTFVESYIYAKNIREFLGEYGYAWDFVSIDLEGISADVCIAIPWERMPTRCVCIEHDDRFEDIKRRLAPFDFRVLTMNGTNLVMVR